MKKQKPTISKEFHEAILAEVEKLPSSHHPAIIEELKKKFTKSINLRKRKQPKNKNI